VSSEISAVNGESFSNENSRPSGAGGNPPASGGVPLRHERSPRPPSPRSEALPDRSPRGPPRLGPPRAAAGRDARPRRASARGGAQRPVRRDPDLAASFLRTEERADLRAVSLSASPDQLGRRRVRSGRVGDLEQVPAAVEGEAPLQPDEFRDRGGDARDGPRLGLPGAVGQRRVLRIPSRMRRDTRRASRRAVRRHVRLPRGLPRSVVRPLGLAGRAGRDPAPPAAERRASSLRVLHDLGSADDPRFARRPDPLRVPRRRRRGLDPVPPLPHQRAPLVARPLLARRSADRSHPAGPPLRLGGKHDRPDAGQRSLR